MKLNLKIISSFVIVLVTAGFLYLWRIKKTNQLWDDYSVFYVENTVPESEVLTLLEKNGCSGVISKSLQTNPFEKESGVYNLFIDNSYLQERLKYFTDKDNRYNLYYIPQNEKNNALKIIDSIQKSHDDKVKLGIDAAVRYPVAVPLLVLVLCVFMTVFAENKIVFMTLSVCPLLMSFACPYYPVAAAVCLLLVAVFITQRLWGRRKTLVEVYINSYTLSFFLAFEVVCFVYSAKTGILATLVSFSIVALSVILLEAQKQLELKRNFSFVYIISSRLYPAMTKKTSYLCVVILVPIIVFTIMNLSLVSVKTSPLETDLYIPSPVIKNSEDYREAEQLVDLEDCYRWVWNTVTFPYKNINKGFYKENDTDRISIKHYKSTDTGILVTEDFLEYDDSFKKSAYDRFDGLENPSVEKLLKSQESNVIFGYRKTSAENSNNGEPGKLNNILLFVAMGVPLLLLVYYYVFGRKKL